MIQEIISQWENNKHLLQAEIEKEHPSSYDGIFSLLFKHVLTDKEYNLNEISVIDNGHYQGTRIFFIHEDTYQPCASDYLYCNVNYGSCSGCDTFEAIRQYDNDIPSSEQVKDYMMLALHMVQSLKQL
jgi:hypothetical protein